MSPSLNNTELEWLAQYAAMRKALAGLSTAQPSGKGKGYGHEIVLEYEDPTGSSGSDDLWNISSDDELDAEKSSDTFDNTIDCQNGRPKSAYPYGQKWLGSKCLAFANSKPGMDAEELQQKLSAMLASDLTGLHARLLLLPETD